MREKEKLSFLPENSTVHFMGIGGAGMSSLAALLLDKGFVVSGCDLEKTVVTERLKAKGAEIFYEHHLGHIDGISHLIYSPAVPRLNSELQAAKEKEIPVWCRSELLEKIAASKKGIAVTGSHGKTSTSGMLAMILKNGGLDPDISLGAEVIDLEGNAASGLGDYFVFEADESDGSFARFDPEIFVITNLDDDHMDYYRSFEKLQHTFENYIREKNQNGWLILSYDDPVLKKWKKELFPDRSWSFGFKSGADVSAQNIVLNEWGTNFDLYFQKDKLGAVCLRLPGRYNILNALAACACALKLQVPFSTIRETLAGFKGVGRRFEFKGKEKNILVVDDYAHHPTEIEAALDTARLCSGGRLICVFQPHRYTRTRDLGGSFPAALAKADEVVLTDIYPASEKPIQGVSGELLYKESQKAGFSHFSYVPDMKQIPGILEQKICSGDMVMTVGAGNVNEVGEHLIRRLKN